MKLSIIVPNHGRDLTGLKNCIPLDVNGVEFIEVNLGYERSKQRNIGIQLSTGEALLILDSDQTIDPGLIEECKYLLENGVSSIYIPEEIIASSFFGRIRNFERSFLTGTHVDVPRAVLKKDCPMFDENLHGPEDADWGNRIQGTRWISSNKIYHHDDIPFLEYCRKKAYYTKSMRRYENKWPDDPCINLVYRCWTVFTQNGKWRKLIRHPILTIGIIFLLTVRGIIYAWNK